MRQLLDCPIPSNEAERLAAVRALEFGDAPQTAHFASLIELGKALFDTPVAAISLIDEAWQRVLSSAGLVEQAFPRSASICAQTIMSGEVFAVPDLRADPRFASLPYVQGAPFFRFYAGVPLTCGSGLNLGSFCIFGHEPRILTDTAREQLAHFGVLASSLLNLQRTNIALRANEKLLREAASTDPLTGCLNRIGMRELVGDLFEQATSAEQGAGLIYVDIDHFKRINDRFGHPAGDAVLCAVAERIRGSVRAKDWVGRIGGDEFCVILRELPGLREMEKITGRLVSAFQAPVQVDNLFIPCSVSVGAAMAPLHATTREGIAKQADIALYQAKEAGRAQFRIAA